jgi:hypothetical protein
MEMNTNFGGEESKKIAILRTVKIAGASQETNLRLLEKVTQNRVQWRALVLAVLRRRHLQLEILFFKVRTVP